ncbi:MAG: hypothetical protein WA347_01625 [Rhabdochlamydiaceae bacterium]
MPRVVAGATGARWDTTGGEGESGMISLFSPPTKYFGISLIACS